MFGCCKTFSGKYIFSGNANFRKRKMFPWCLVAFQKIFRKMLSGVWKRRRKTQIQKNTSHNPEKKSSTTTLNTVRRPHRRSRSEIVIAISPSSRDRNQQRDLTKRRSRSRIFLSRRRSRFFSGLWFVFFWICVFLLLFQTPENIFRKIF